MQGGLRCWLLMLLLGGAERYVLGVMLGIENCTLCTEKYMEGKWKRGVMDGMEWSIPGFCVCIRTWMGFEVLIMISISKIQETFILLSSSFISVLSNG